MPTLIYLYGPPAVGKLTVAERLSALTGWPIFHNHLSVNAVRPVFGFGSKPFIEVVQRFRLDVVHTAMTEGINLIFTNNSAWGGPDSRARFVAFAAAMRNAAETGGGRPVCPVDRSAGGAGGAPGEFLTPTTRQARRPLAFARAAWVV